MLKLYDYSLKKINEAQWEMEKDYQGADLHFFAEEKILKQMEEIVFIQARNVAMLPGLVSPVCIMPDAHSGYGAPIGTVFAMDSKKGYVSPGAVGYDINCLSPDSEILTSLGYRKKIRDFLTGRNIDFLTSIDFSTKKPISSEILFILKKKSNPSLIKITTLLGKTILATFDHPFFTQEGMKEAARLSPLDKVALYFFEGVEYEKPTDEIILDENLLLQSSLPFKSDYQRDCLINELKKRNLLPLKYSSRIFPYLIKIFGYNLGDGSLIFTKKTQSCEFWEKEEDLKEIVLDIRRLHYKGKIYKRKRIHKIKKYRFSRVENFLHLSVGSLVLLFSSLGCPVGDKTKQDFQIPFWLKKAPLWQKRLFLAAFFGAEMSAPKVIKNHQSTFYMPTISINKQKRYLQSGLRFLNDLKKMLSDFNIKSTPPAIVEKKDDKVRLRLQIYADPRNLINFYSKISFEYHTKKKFLANVALAYLKLKNYFVSKRKRIEEEAKQNYKERGDLKKILLSADLKLVNKRFLERSIFEERKNLPRIPKTFPSFHEFLKERTAGLGETGAVWDQLILIEKVPYQGEVYDFTINHQCHNFIANSFVVSNCGMRLMMTNLFYKEVKPLVEQLINLLFNSVPAGVGGKGFLKVGSNELKKLVEGGVGQLIKKGIGWEDDINYIEEKGLIKGADFSCVSPKAKERGIDQLATLGSGNHYLEIQRVEDIFDRQTAKKWGIIEKGQIGVMIHCGSRGFGHQICSDYLRIFEKHLPEFKIKLSDRQLVAAPIDSPSAKDYLAAMAAAANFAFVNREAITHQVRRVFEKVFVKSAEDLDMRLVYDVAHNMAKFEGDFLVHRKGATRSFPHQPVIIGGSMETGSYLLVGEQEAMKKTYGSTAHGSGRTMSRAAAKKIVQGKDLWQKMKKEGIYVKSATLSGLAEEAGLAYKNISDVVKSIELAGLSKPVAYFRPLGNIKG